MYILKDQGILGNVNQIDIKFYKKHILQVCSSRIFFTSDIKNDSIQTCLLRHPYLEVLRHQISFNVQGLTYEYLFI